YWPLGEASGTSAANLAARAQGQYQASYAGARPGVGGALVGSADTAVSLAPAAGSGPAPGPLGCWELADAAGAGVLADGCGAHPATPTVGVSAGVPGRLLAGPATAAVSATG